MPILPILWYVYALYANAKCQNEYYFLSSTPFYDMSLYDIGLAFWRMSISWSKSYFWCITSIILIIYALYILFKKDKTILFTTNTTVLKQILPNKSILGENKKGNNVIMHQFENNLFYVIGSYKMLKQGNNLDNLNNCIILASNNANINLDTIQRVGRLRLDNENRGNVIVLYNDDTFETKYLTKIPTILHNTTPVLCDNLKEFYDKYENIESLKGA